MTPRGRGLKADLEDWWDEETDDWDASVTGQPAKPIPGGLDLWDCMPVVDSKAVARTSHLFEKHLGIPLDVKLIEKGGYPSIETMIHDLVPKMEQKRKEAMGDTA